MPYMLPPGLGYAHPVSAEARRMEMLKMTAREADAWMTLHPSEQYRLNHVRVSSAEQLLAHREEAVMMQRSQADIGISENERIARMSLNRIWEQPTPVAPAAYGYANAQAYDITPPGPRLLAQQQQAQQIPAMRPSYMIDSPFYLCDPAYIHPGYAPVPAPAPAPMTFNPFEYDPSEYHPGAFHAPAMHPRAIQQEVPVSASFQAAGRSHPMQTLTLNEALATWYAEQLVMVLVKPGMFRPGVSGQSDEVWSAAGREQDSWARVGQVVLGSPTSWTARSQSHSRRTSLNRDPCCEAYDPWEIMWKNRTSISERLVNFVHELIQRMSIGPTAVVAAVWYLHGLGLHDGDGDKGRRIRMLLRKMYASDDEAVERRVAVLGLLLAGKWLDDNSFLTKSWTEVTHIPVEEVDKLERAALADLYFSLHIPLGSWADYVNMRWTELLTSPERPDDAYDVLLPILDRMVADARDKETDVRKEVDPADLDSPYYDLIDERLEAAYYAATAAEAAAEAESIAAALAAQDKRHLVSSPMSTPVSQWFSPRADASGEQDDDDDMEFAARNVSALVDDDMGDADEVSEVDDAEEYADEASAADQSDDESDDEYLDYDGAARFLPTMAELRRSSSNSSAQSELVEQWRKDVSATSAHADNDDVFAFAPPYSPPRLFPPRSPLPELPADHVWAEDRPAHSRVTSSALRGEPIDPRFLPARCRAVQHDTAPVPPAPAVPSHGKHAQRSSYKETGVFLEPGIAQVRPPTGSSVYQHQLHQRQPLNPLPHAANTARAPAYPYAPIQASAQTTAQAQDYKGWASTSHWQL